MFILAYPENAEHIAYYDTAGNKYIARGGTLVWRINNPGLVRSHSHVAKRNGAIGACGNYAIFPSSEHGRKALSSWLHLKKYYNGTLKILAKHYQPTDSEGFIFKLHAIANLPINQKLKSFSKSDWQLLLHSIEKLCNFTALGNENISLVPKISGKIEHSQGEDDSYLVGNDIILSKREAVAWCKSYRLDATIVHERNGHIHLRSRPHHFFWHVKVYDENPSIEDLLPPEKSIATIVRTIGKKKSGQCIWGFINGISNTKKEAKQSAELICRAANGEAIFSLPNDTRRFVDLLVCGILKLSIDAPIVVLAEYFFRYLLAEAKRCEPKPPIVIFAHSQGAIICERALEHLSISKKQQLRIFTFGGGSFVAPQKSHPDSHNYTSAADPVCLVGSPNLQMLALQEYHGRKKGLNREDVIQLLAYRDAELNINPFNSVAIERYIKERMNFYRDAFEKINNVTVLDPDAPVQHGFGSKCYQAVMRSIVKKYQQQAKQ
ncbi:MAG: hypothetical protein WAM28_07260 [Chlamydiales bacterium]